MARWLATSSHNGGIRTGPQLAQTKEISKSLERSDSMVARSSGIGSFLYVYIRSEVCDKKITCQLQLSGRTLPPGRAADKQPCGLVESELLSMALSSNG